MNILDKNVIYFLRDTFLGMINLTLEEEEKNNEEFDYDFYACNSQDFDINVDAIKDYIFDKEVNSYNDTILKLNIIFFNYIYQSLNYEELEDDSLEEIHFREIFESSNLDKYIEEVENNEELGFILCKNYFELIEDEDIIDQVIDNKHLLEDLPHYIDWKNKSRIENITIIEALNFTILDLQSLYTLCDIPKHNVCELIADHFSLNTLQFDFPNLYFKDIKDFHKFSFLLVQQIYYEVYGYLIIKRDNLGLGYEENFILEEVESRIETNNINTLPDNKYMQSIIIGLYLDYNCNKDFINTKYPKEMEEVYQRARKKVNILSYMGLKY